MGRGGGFVGASPQQMRALDTLPTGMVQNCYKPLDSGEFTIVKPLDKDGVIMNNPDEEQCYVQARDGDNLVTPFQCDLCHFRNLMKCDPVDDLAQDIRVQKLIWRANLDAIWSREPGTVNSTLQLDRQGARIASSLGFSGELYRPMGPFPFVGHIRHGSSYCDVTDLSQPGRYDKTVQFGTVRKFKSCFSIIYHATAEGQKAMVMAKDVRKLTITECPTDGEFFEWFV